MPPDLLADWLTASSDQWLVVEADGSWRLVTGLPSPHVVAVKCPGMSSLKASDFTGGAVVEDLESTIRDVCRDDAAALINYVEWLTDALVASCLEITT